MMTKKMHPAIGVAVPPENIAHALNAVEVTAYLWKDRYVIRNLDEMDALINDLIAARNKVWPYPKFEANP